MSNKYGRLKENRDMRIFSFKLAEMFGSIEKAVIINHIAREISRSHKYQSAQLNVNGFKTSGYMTTKEAMLDKFPSVGDFDKALEELIDEGIVEVYEDLVGNRTIYYYFISNSFVRDEYNLIEGGQDVYYQNR